MSAEHPNVVDVAKFYTRGVKFPRLIGTTADGTRIPGGPYTMLQAVGGLLTFGTLQVTKSLWTNGSLVSDMIVLGAVTGGVVYALRLVRVGGRNPASALVGVLMVLSQPKHGRLQGRRIRVRRPHQVRGVPRTIALPGSGAGGGTSPAARNARRPDGEGIHEGLGTAADTRVAPGLPSPGPAPAHRPTPIPLDEAIFALTSATPPYAARQSELADPTSTTPRAPGPGPGPGPDQGSGARGVGTTSGTAVARLLAQAAAKQSVS